MALTQVSSDGIKNLNVKTADLENSGVTAGTYGSATLIPALVIDAKGRVTSASTNSISTDLVNDTSPQLGGNLDVNTKNILFGDSSDGSSDDVLIFGDDSDLKIYHDNSNSRTRIQHSTDKALEILQGGNAGMLIQNQNSFNIEIKTNAKDAIKCIANGAVELYYDNSKKLETSASGINVTGNIHLGDSHYLYLGTGNDFLLGHAGDHSFLRNDTGELYIRSNGIRLVNQGNYETYIKCVDNGSVELYHDNIKTFETISGGAKLQGGEGLAAHLYMFADEGDDNADKWVFRADASSSQLKLRNYADGSWEESIIANGNGAVELYHDNSKKLETESSGARTYGDHNVTGEIHLTTDNQSLKIGSGADLRIFHNGTHNYVNFVNGALIFQNNGTGVAYFHDSDGHFLPWTNNTFDLGSSGNRWRNVYTNDLNLSNEGGANDVDGTWGSFTIQEGEESLFLINRRNGKKYKFNLTEVS